MSNSADNGAQPEREAFQKLERAVEEALERLGQARARASAAEKQSGELEALLARFTRDEGAAGQMLSRLHALEAENEDLKARLGKGREGVERLLSRIRFLEEQR